MSKLLAIDLDGTLFWPKQITRLIPKKNVEFLRKWIDQGNRLVLITSRSYDFAEQLKKEIDRPVDFINYIGGQIRIDDKLVRDVSIDKEVLHKVLEQIQESCDTLAFIANTEHYPLIIRDNKDTGFIMKLFYRLWYLFQGKYREKYIVSNEIFDSEVYDGKPYITRIVFGVKKKNVEIAKNLNKSFREKYTNIEFSWTDIIIEMSPQGCTKSESLKYYVDKLGFWKNDVYVVGDSGNDITMFQEFYDHSYCMAHSYSSVKKYAKHIISRVHKLDKLVLEGEKNDPNI